MHIFGVSVPLCCMFYHFIVTVLTLVDYIVYVRTENRVDQSLPKVHLACAIIGLVTFGAGGAPLFLYGYKYGLTRQARMDRLLSGIACMFLGSSLPMLIIELVIMLAFNFSFAYPLDGMVFVLHAIAALVGGLISWFAYLRVVSRALHNFRGPERQILDVEDSPKRTHQLVFSTPLPGQPDII